MVLPRNIRDIPSGKDVAKVFPWMAQGQFNHLTAGNNTGRFTILPRSESYKNKTPGEIEIHEVRLLFARAFDDRDKTIITYDDESWDARIQMHTSRRALIEKWIPARCLGNRPHDVQFKQKIATKFLLPVPYFLQYAARFKIDLRLPPDMVAFSVGGEETEVLSGVYLDICLRGWDPETKVPVVMNKQVRMPTALGNVTVVSFDEEMDTALRHMWVEDISFGFVNPNVDSAAVPDFDIYGPGGPPYHVDVRFHPTTGPEWVEGNDGWIRLSGIAGPPTMTWTADTDATTYFPYIVHRPEAPIVLKPKDEFNLLVRMSTDVNLVYDTSLYYCWVIGTQEWNR